MTRVLFMGSPAFAVPALTALAERPDLTEVVAVVTQPDKPAGRGQKLTPCPVAIAAQARGLPILQPTKMKPPETLASFAAYSPDLIVVAAYGRILPKPILDLPKHGCLNLHASLLPRWRGASPILASIMAGDAESGVDIMRMEEGLDTGAVYGERRLPITAKDTTASLTVKLADAGAKLLVELLPNILNGTLKPVPQPEAGVTYAGMLKKEDGWLDFTRPAVELERKVRAMNPWPLAFTSKSGQRLQILEASVADGSGTPGSVLATKPEGVLVATGTGALSLHVVKPAGRPAMPVEAWISGRGIAVGEHFDPLPTPGA